MLGQRPGHGEGAAVLFRLPRQSGGGGLQVGDNAGQRAACHQHQGAVQDVLAGGTLVDRRGGGRVVLLGLRAQVGEQRDDRVAAALGTLGQGCGVVEVCPEACSTAGTASAGTRPAPASTRVHSSSTSSMAWMNW